MMVAQELKAVLTSSREHIRVAAKVQSSQPGQPNPSWTGVLQGRISRKTRIKTSKGRVVKGVSPAPTCSRRESRGISWLASFPPRSEGPEPHASLPSLEH